MMGISGMVAVYCFRSCFNISKTNSFLTSLSFNPIDKYVVLFFTIDRLTDVIIHSNLKTPKRSHEGN